MDDIWWENRKASKGLKHLNLFRSKDFPLFSKLDKLFSTNTATGEYATSSTSFPDAAKGDIAETDDVDLNDDDDLNADYKQFQKTVPKDSSKRPQDVDNSKNLEMLMILPKFPLM